MKTKLHHYIFDMRKPEEANAYKAMCHNIEANAVEARGHQMHAIPDTNRTSYGNQTQDVEIDPSFLFDNQWNETTESGNRRLFDWYEAAIFVNGRESDNIKWGHWLEITPEMSQARAETLKCGYCGKHYGPLHEPAPGDFCAACLDSPYLKESELHLLRLLPLVGLQVRDRLTDTERSDLLPAFVDRQTTGNDSRAKQRKDQQRADVLEKFATKTANATTERDGMLWLWERGFDLDNVLYYSHTDKFGFGWRTPLDESVASKLLDVISEFPFQYEIKATNRTYENCA